jgi:4-aminobutyrate aminotransferase
MGADQGRCSIAPKNITSNWICYHKPGNLMENEHLERRRRTAMPRGVAVLCHVHADQATNAALKDVEGREYLDFASGIAVLNTGHRHPRVLEAFRRQLDRFMHTAFQIVPYESAIALA